MPLGALDIIIAADTAQLRKGMDTAVGIMQTSTQKMESFAKTTGASIAGYFALSNLQNSIKQSLDLADSLGKMSQKIGMSVDALYSLQAAGKLADVDIQTLEKSLLKFNKGLGTAEMGSGDTANALKNLGISLKDSGGHMKMSDQYLGEVADKFKNMPDGVEKSTLAMQLFGKSGADMIPLLNGGSEALSEFSGIMDAETAASAEKFNDSLTTVGLAVDAVWMQMTSALSPTLSAIADDFVNVAKEGKGTGQTLGDDLAKGMKVAIGLGYNIVGSFSMAGHAIGNFGAAVSMLAEGDFKGAKFAWDKMKSDFEKEGKSWDARLQKVMSATPESQKDSDDQRARSRRGLEDFQANEAKKEAAIKKAAAEAQKIKKAYASMESEQYKASHNEYENSIRDIEDKGKSYLAQGVKQIDVDRFVEQSKTDLKAKYTAKADEEALAAIKAFNEEQLKLEFEADQQREAALKTYNEGVLSAKIETYTALKDYSSAYYLQEEEKMRKLAETGWYTHEQMLAIKKADDEKFQKEQWDRDNKFWADTFVNINKAMEDQFFNAMNGKFTSFGNWLKDFWSSITQSMSRGLSKSLADSIMGTNDSGGGIQNIFKSYGGLAGVFGSSATPAALMGATTDDAGLTTTSGGTVYDSAGKIIQSGSDMAAVSDALNIASTATTAYSVITGGLAAIGTNIATGFGAVAQGLGSMGFAGAGAAVSDFGIGMGSTFFSGSSVVGGSASMTAGAIAGGALVGGLGGYALGSVGDKLLGADTKAANYGAIGGAIGGAVGSIVPVIGTAVGAVVGAALGSLIGGAFGKTKTSVVGSGTQFFDTASADYVNASYYTDMYSKKKSWFSSSERRWTVYSGIPDTELTKIKNIFVTYDYLLGQLGNLEHITLAAGKYSGASFQDQLAKNFITMFSGVQQTITRAVTGWFGGVWNVTESNPEFNRIYSYWSNYASAINKTVAEALTTSVGEYITKTRSFTEWKLGSGSIDQLKFTADYLAKDFSLLADSMGASGVTVENYLQKYDEAIKASFTPETLTSWKNLGDALIAATDANKAYIDSLKKTTALVPSDMMLGRTATSTTAIDIRSLVDQNDAMGVTFDQMKAALYEVVKVLKAQLTAAQLGTVPQGTPA